jgi:hypothetical protein
MSINVSLRGFNHSQWKLLLLDKIEKIGGDKVWLLKKVGIQKISTKFNPFWRDIFLNWFFESKTFSICGNFSLPSS